MLNKVLFKNSTFSSTGRFSKAFFQTKLDIVFLIVSIFAFLQPQTFRTYDGGRGTRMLILS